MGAINFSLDSNLVTELKKSLSLTHFVETGTFEGDTIEHVKSLFDRFISIELSREYYEKSENRFNNDYNIEILFGDSKNILPEIIKRVKNNSVLYWLDAHLCVADATAGEISQCPLN